jgi:hypothetical protein
MKYTWSMRFLRASSGFLTGRSTGSRCGASNAKSWRERRDRIRLDDMDHLSAQLSANCQRQTAYLLLAEMSRAADQSSEARSKRDDRLALRPKRAELRRA